MVNRLKAHPIASFLFGMLAVLLLGLGLASNDPWTGIISAMALSALILGAYLLIAQLVGKRRHSMMPATRLRLRGAPQGRTTDGSVLSDAERLAYIACDRQEPTRRPIIIGFIVHVLLGVCALFPLSLGAGNLAFVIIYGSWLAFLIAMAALALGAVLWPRRRGWARGVSILPSAWIGALVVAGIVRGLIVRFGG